MNEKSNNGDGGGNRGLHYYLFEFFDEHGDPRVVGYPLMRTPWPIVSGCLTYLIFVKLIGPAIMRDRKPFDLLTQIRIYNFAMVAWNAFGFYTCCQLLNYGLDTFGCRPIDPTARDEKSLSIIHYGYMFLISRIIEFIDTICFVLRKKQRQISGFHVFHHFSVPIAVWMFVKFAPGGNSGIFPFLNTFIHTIMYLYYLLATWNSLHPYLGWKKYLTQIQIVQFIIMIMHSTQPLFIPGCKFPRTFLYMNIFFSLVFIYLFTTFYITTYGKQTVQVAKNVSRRISQQIVTTTRRLSQMHSTHPVITAAAASSSSSSSSETTNNNNNIRKDQ